MKRTKIVIKASYDERDSLEVEDGYVDIISENGKPLFSLSLKKNGSLEVSTSGTTKFDNVVLDSSLSVKPIASNTLIIERIPYIK